ncbi:MAG: ABC transporter substrate-binding protein [Vulcanimicrobiaceae bacterium]
MLAIFALLGLCACGAREAETRNPNAIICAWIAGPDGFDPFATIGSAATMAEDLVYTPLIDIGPNLLPSWRTSLAYRVDISDGGTRYLMHLRHGVRWSDGMPLTAADVVFTMRLGTNPGLLHGVSADFTLMRSVRAIGRHTVEVRLTRPSPPFLVNALGETKPLPKHLLDRYPPDSQREAEFINTDTAFSQHPVVSGPWRIVRNVPEAYLILAPNPSYWGPKPHIQEMVFRVYPEQDSLYAAVAAGEVDVTDIPPNLWRVRGRLRGNHRFISWPWNVTFSLLPNYRDPSISWIRDRRIKQAMMYAIDRDFIVAHIMSGQADVLNGPVPTFSPYYDPAVQRYPYDPQKARALLAAAGWRMHGDVRTKDGRELRITLKTGGATDAVASDVAELIQADFKAVGIDCRLENEELQTFFSDVNASRFQLALRGNILSPYPDDYKWYDSSQTRANGGYNYSFYSNPQIDAAIESARTAPSLDASRADMNRYQRLAARDLPAIYLFSNRLGAVVPKNLTGYELDPDAPAALPMGLQFWRLTRL